MESVAFFVVVPPAGAVQGTARLRYLLETVHDVYEGYLVCGGISFYPHADITLHVIVFETGYSGLEA